MAIEDNDEKLSSIPRRTVRNKELYENINNSDLDNFNVNSNISVLNGPANEIDIEQIKSMLDRKYKAEPKRRSITIEEEEVVEEKKTEEPTKEYDLNSVLEKAREGNKVDYNIERLKKLRMTQYDILKDLNLEPNDDEKDDLVDNTSDPEKDLMTLIDIATGNEPTELDPLDILTDLKGSDDTIILEGVNTLVDEDLLKEINEKKVKVEESDAEEKDDLDDTTEQVPQIKKKSSDLSNSFYTNSVKLSEKDFDEFDDLKDDVKGSKVLLWIIVIILIIALLCGALYIINNMFDLGLF